MMAVLTLQYPDSYEGRLKVIASTYNQKAMLAFKKACLEKAQLKTLGFAEDEVLLLDSQHEYKRLLDLLNLLIPDTEGTPEAGHG
jgi:hypothetical protein